MMFQLVIVLAALLQLARAAEWATVSGTTATVLVGVGASSYGAVSGSSDNGSGAYMGLYDWNAKTFAHEPLTAGLILDAGVTSKGFRVLSGTFPVFQSNDGKTFTRAPINGVSQSVQVYGDNKENIALTGVFLQSPGSTVNGVATSTDSGATWSLSSNMPVSSPRYGAFPTSNTWYVSSGMWGEDVASAKEQVGANSTWHSKKGMREITSRISFVDGQMVVDSSSASLIKTQKERRHDQGMKAGGDTVTGWFGAVSKTTDGGKTWTQVFSSDLTSDYYYFNSISCSSETNCVVVGEGENADGSPMVLAFTTTDGGATWTKSLSLSEYGLMGSKFSSSSDVWLAGITKDGRSVGGKFWKSTDNGLTFTEMQTLANCLPTDLEFDHGVGVVACSSSSGASCQMAMYQ